MFDLNFVENRVFFHGLDWALDQDQKGPDLHPPMNPIAWALGVYV